MNQKNKMSKRYLAILIVMTSGLFIGITIFTISCHETVNIKPIKFETREKISFTSSWGAYDSKASRINTIFKKLIQSYEDLEIQDSSMAGSDFLFLLKTDFASGNDPDIFGLWPGSDINLLIEQGKVADLTELLEQDPDWYNSFKKESWHYVTVNDRIYGLPIEIIYEGLFINRDLFEAYNIKIPTSYNELLDAVKQFRTYNIIPIAYNDTPEGSYIYQNIVMMLGGKSDIECPLDENNRIKECFINGMYYMKELYEAGAFPANWYNIDDKARNDLFIQKKAAMIVQGSWFIGDNVVSSTDQTIDIMPFPQMPNGKADPSAIIFGCGNGIFHLSQNAWNSEKHRVSCLKILKALTSSENVSEFAKDSGFISNVDLGNYAPPETIMSMKGSQLIESSKELIGPVDWFIDRTIWENIIIKEFPTMLKGEISPEAIYEKVYQSLSNDKR